MFKFSTKLLINPLKYLSLFVGIGIGANNIASALPLSSNPDMGVVISKENFHQWPEISARLQTTGVNYCVLDIRDWQEERDLRSLRIIFLPNVSNLSGEQVLSLSNWVKNGGKVIVSGPTGKLSTQEVQATLKKVLGGYWGFGITKPSTLVVKDENLGNQQQLSSTLVGGVVIPADINSQTLAIWMAEGKSPAVIKNNNTTYFGWRWGVENVASAEFDTAWLNTALKEYGVNTIANYTTKSAVKNTVESCQNNHLASTNVNSQPTTSSNNQNQSLSVKNQPTSPPQTLTANNNQLVNNNRPPTNPKVINTVKPTNNNIARTSSNNPQISSQQINEMVTELESLIYRVESALITGESKQLKYTASTSQLADQVLKTNKNNNTLNFSNRKANEALISAKQIAQQFPELAKENYNQARQTWLNARRNLWDTYPVDRNISQPEVRAIWLDRGTIVKTRSKEELAPIFDRMAEAGINTIFFETINASYPIYPSRVAPEQNPLTKGWDPLQAAIELAHERGMELHAWAWIFAGANQGHNVILNLPDTYLGPVLSRHPDWVLKDQNGDVFNYTPGFKKAFFDPANPEVRRYLLTLLQEIVANYDVDGVQLDYIRYPFQDNITKQYFGYTDVSRGLFKERYGIDPKELKPSSPQWELWKKFKIQQVDSFVIEASQALKRQRPDLILSTAVFPMERQQRLNTLQQNWEEWIYNQSVDMMVLMTYALHTGSFAERAKPVYDYSQDISSFIIPGIRLLNVPDTETADQMQLLRNMPANGFALFAAENLNPNLERIFKQTQGGDNKPSTGEPVPHREPFITAFARYQNLRKEWNFLLVNHQIIVEPRYLKEWSRSVDLLGDRLDKLAKNPSTANFQVAQAELIKFRENLPRYLSQQSQQNPLQLQSWQNRLLTVENLLNYGQRTILVNSTINNMTSRK